MKKERLRRRKSKAHPLTIGRDCRYLKYENGKAVCERKVRDARGLAKSDILCNKTKHCWYEPTECATVTRLSRMIKKGKE